MSLVRIQAERNPSKKLFPGVSFCLFARLLSWERTLALPASLNVGAASDRTPGSWRFSPPGYVNAKQFQPRPGSAESLRAGTKVTTRSMTTILLKDLAVTQDGLRHSRDSLRCMVRFVAEGGCWTADQLAKHHAAFSLPGTPEPIELVRVEDGQCYVHNGHHRCVATWLGGRFHLRKDEYRLRDRTYDWFLESNPETGYFLTFDPRIHVRRADFIAVQREARVRFQVDPATAESWRAENTDRYRCGRAIRTVPALAWAISRCAASSPASSETTFVHGGHDHSWFSGNSRRRRVAVAPVARLQTSGIAFHAESSQVSGLTVET